MLLWRYLPPQKIYSLRGAIQMPQLQLQLHCSVYGILLAIAQKVWCWERFGAEVETDLCLAFCSCSSWSDISLTESCCFLRRAEIWDSLWICASSRSRRSFCSSASRFLFNSIYTHQGNRRQQTSLLVLIFIVEQNLVGNNAVVSAVTLWLLMNMQDSP